jgi:hypothetical protein
VDQLRTLTDHSRWIDLATAAKLALTLHGGYYAHEKLFALATSYDPGKLTNLNLGCVTAGTMKKGHCTPFLAMKSRRVTSLIPLWSGTKLPGVRRIQIRI